MTLTQVLHWVFALTGWTAGGLLVLFGGLFVLGRPKQPVARGPRWHLDARHEASTRVIDLRDRKTAPSRARQ